MPGGSLLHAHGSRLSSSVPALGSSGVRGSQHDRRFESRPSSQSSRGWRHCSMARGALETSSLVELGDPWLLEASIASSSCSGPLGSQLLRQRYGVQEPFDASTSLSLLGENGTSSLSLRSGLTMATEIQNARAAVGMERLSNVGLGIKDAASPTMQRPCMLGIGSSPTSMRKLGLDCGTGQADVMDFTSASEVLMSDILELRQRFEAFEPLAHQGGTLLNQKSRSRKAGGSHRRDCEDEDEGEGLLDRLAAYKMTRRVEPELQPLTTRFERAPPLALTDQRLLKYNLTKDALAAWSPHRKAERHRRRRGERSLHGCEVATRNTAQLEALCQRHGESLQRKYTQGQLARHRGRGDEIICAGETAKRWLSLSIVAGFLQQLRGRLLRKEERPARRNSIRSCASPTVSLAAQTAQLHEAMLDRCFVSRMELLAAMLRRRLHVRDRRHHAKTVYGCLAGWKLAGRCALSLRCFSQRVRKLQRWWRCCSKRLRAIRDKLARRWERLERAAMFERSGRGETLDEAVRLRFLEHELRARRYGLLPAIQVWEMDCKRWRSEVDAWRQTREAHLVMESNAYLAQPVFGFPPMRPSYLPAAFGEHALEGDKQILDMWRRARRHPNGGGWAKIISGTLDQAGDQAKGEHPMDKDLTFDDVSTADLAIWGIEPCLLPCLQGSGKPDPTEIGNDPSHAPC